MIDWLYATIIFFLGFAVALLFVELVDYKIERKISRLKSEKQNQNEFNND